MPSAQENRAAPRRGRPLKGSRRRVRVSFTLDPDDVSWIRDRAQAEKASMSDVLDRALAAVRSRPEPFRPRSEPAASHIRIPVPAERIASLCARRHIRRLSIFGSALTGRFGPDSDVDVLVEFEDGREPGLLGLSAMQEELGRVFGGRRVDLRTARELSPLFRGEILRDSATIYGG